MLARDFQPFTGPYDRPVPNRILQSPVILDGDISEEKIADLLGLEAEHPELDFKRSIDISSSHGAVELAKDLGAMQVLGGYILLGADDRGQLTGDMDEVDLRPFDQASLQTKMLKYLPRPLDLRTNTVERANPGEDEKHKVIAIFVGPHPGGCAFFEVHGTYEKSDGTTKKVFMAGDVFWRDGTSSTRMNQAGLEEVIEQRVERAKDEWMAEQQEIRRRERQDLQAAREGRELGEGPLGSVSLDLPTKELSLTVLDLIRRNDAIALRHLLNDSLRRARAILDQEGDIEANLSDLLSKLVCLAAALLEHDQETWFREVLAILVQIYGMPVTEDQVRSFGYSTEISPEEVAPRVWLAVIERVFGLGGLAVRLKKWAAVRQLTLQLPDVVEAVGYDRNWLRHALTMASRARHFEREDQQLSLLTLARNRAVELECLRSDGIAEDDDELLTSIAEFDFLSNVAAIDVSIGMKPGRAYYPNFARFYQERIQGAANRLVSNQAMKTALWSRSNDQLAVALMEIGERAHSEGWRYDGFDSWGETPVGKFIAQHHPGDSPSSIATTD